MSFAIAKYNTANFFYSNDIQFSSDNTIIFSIMKDNFL